MMEGKRTTKITIQMIGQTPLDLSKALAWTE